MKKITKISILIFLIIIGVYLYNKIIMPYFIEYGNCCSCSLSSWHFGSGIKTYLHNKALDCSSFGDCSQYGCAISYYVIPVDLIIILVIILAVIMIGVRNRFFQKILDK